MLSVLGASAQEGRKILAYMAFLFIANSKTSKAHPGNVQRKFEAKESKKPGKKERNPEGRNRKQGPRKIKKDLTRWNESVLNVSNLVTPLV